MYRMLAGILQSLPPAELELVQMAAVVGEVFPLGVLAAVVAPNHPRPAGSRAGRRATVLARLGRLEKTLAGSGPLIRRLPPQPLLQNDRTHGNEDRLFYTFGTHGSWAVAYSLLSDKARRAAHRRAAAAYRRLAAATANCATGLQPPAVGVSQLSDLTGRSRSRSRSRVRHALAPSNDNPAMPLRAPR